MRLGYERDNVSSLCQGFLSRNNTEKRKEEKQ